MDLKIRGKRALVTGAGKGIGRSIALKLASEGVQVWGVSRTETDLQSLCQTMSTHGQEQYYCVLDLASTDAPAELLLQLKRANFMPDIVVHNLGGTLNVTDPMASIREWRRVLRINLEVPIELNLGLIEHMQAQSWGRICHVSSISALENQGPPSYCAAKAALNAYTRSVGRYLSRHNVIMNSVMPGPVYFAGGYWDEVKKNRPDHYEKYLNERLAIGRFADAEEISNVVAFACSDLASYCVGSAFLVDGGQGRVFLNQHEHNV